MVPISYRNVDMTKQFLTKQIRKNAIAANPKAKRLKLPVDSDRLFVSFGRYRLYLIGNILGIIYSKRSQKREAKVFSSLNLLTISVPII